MSKSILVSFNGYPQTPSAFLPDNGLALLAACLLGADHETKILDFNTAEAVKKLYGTTKEELSLRLEEFTDECTELILAENPDFAAFKLWTGEGFKGSTMIAEKVKTRNPYIKTIGGGPHVDYFAQYVFKVTTAFDYLSKGEGEKTIVGFANFVDEKQELASIPNLVEKDGSTHLVERIENLDDLPIPVYDRAFYPSFDEKIGIMVSEWSRGCPYKCDFCGHPSKSGTRTRNRSTKKIIEELETYKRLYQAHVFRSGDSDTSRKALEGVASHLSHESHGFIYAGTTHINNIRTESLEAMKKAGFYSLFFGMESGSQHMLNYSFDKKLKVESIRRVVNETKNAGIKAIVSTIIPAPGESAATKKETLELLLQIRPDSVCVNIPIVAPNTAWYSEASKRGIKLPPNYELELMYFTPKLMLAPDQWDRLSFEIDGKNFYELAKESNDFANVLEANGILTQAIDEIMLMAKYCGVDARTFRDRMRHYLANGDYSGVKKTIHSINLSLSQMPINA
jgi:radical SAM superfamily enzyme YgiQ (UPF0313 family)